MTTKKKKRKKKKIVKPTYVKFIKWLGLKTRLRFRSKNIISFNTGLGSYTKRQFKRATVPEGKVKRKKETTHAKVSKKRAG